MGRIDLWGRRCRCRSCGNLVVAKRPLMLALMVLLMVVSALAAWFFVQQSSERVAVVGVAHDVAWGQEVQASDLVAVEVVPDPALKPVTWDQRSTLVGQLAATDLQTGMLLTARSVTDLQVPPKGKALVGVLVKSGQVPVTPLSPQDQVLLVPADQQAAPSAAGRCEAGTSGGLHRRCDRREWHPNSGRVGARGLRGADSCGCRCGAVGDRSGPQELRAAC